MAVYTGTPNIQNILDAGDDPEPATMTGANLADTITGSAFGDLIHGGDGGDTIDGGLGANEIYGEGGDDDIEVLSAVSDPYDSNLIDGGEGEDTIHGGLGADTIRGGDDNDTILEVNHTINGIAQRFSADTIYGDGGDDYVEAGTGDDTVFGGSGEDTLHGGLHDDTVDGGADDDQVFGGDGRDVVKGGAGNDLVSGDAGNDTLYGGKGIDNLLGDAVPFAGPQPGRDVFKWKSVAEIKNDRIGDFRKGFDTLDLSQIDAKPGGGDDRFKFIGDDGFHKAKGELHFTKVNRPGTFQDQTIVEGDINGDGKADFTLYLSGLLNLAKGDFEL